MIRNTFPKLGPIACLFVIAAMAPFSAGAQDNDKSSIVGVWNATAESEQGERSSVWTILRNGDTYEGEYVSAESDQRRELSNIRFDGKDLTFEIEIEAEGQELLIEVESEVDGDKLKGSWSASRDGEELAAGSLTAVKKVTVDFSGEWESLAVLPNGDELESSLALKGKNKDWSGSIDPHGDQTKIDKISIEGKSLRLEFKLDVEGGERQIVIEASLKSEKSLEGDWFLLDDAGNEEASGEWSAKRVAQPKSGKSNAGFDGSSLESYRGYSEEAIGSGWTMTDGVLHLDGTKSGDIITKQEFGNFELEFEWKISEGGNSGVMYRVSLGDKKPYLTGPEYQVLDDDKHKDGKLASHRSGSLYALYEPENKKLKPVGQWNTSKIILNGNSVEHWLNGIKVVDAEIGSDDWNARVADSKFKSWEKFGKNKKGHICFQDHGNPVWFKNIKVKSLD